MSRFNNGESRSQVIISSETIDGYIEGDNPLGLSL